MGDFFQNLTTVKNSRSSVTWGGTGTLNCLRGIFSLPEPCLGACIISSQVRLPSWSNVLANAAFCSTLQSATQNPLTVYCRENTGWRCCQMVGSFAEIGSFSVLLARLR